MRLHCTYSIRLNMNIFYKYYKQGTKSNHIWHLSLDIEHLSLDIEHPTGIVSPS